MATTLEYNVKVNDQAAIKSLGQLEDELSAINDELRDIPAGSQAFKDLSKQSQALTKELDKVNDAITGLQFEDKLQAADGAAKIFAGSLTAVVGTLGVLGVESEAFGKFEEKAASAIAVGLGIKDVSEGFMQFSTVMKKSGIAAKLFGNTTRTALIATGVGAFIVALGLVVTYWDDIVKAVSKAADAFPFVGKAIDAIKGAFNSLFEAARPVLEFLGILPDEAERALIAAKQVNSELIAATQRELAILQASGAAAKEIYDARKQLLEAELLQLQTNAAEKEAIYAKETEILALNAAEQKRIREELAGVVVREKQTTVNAIISAGLKEVETAAIVGTGVKIINNEKKKADSEYAIAVVENQEKLDAARSNSLDNMIALAGAESKVGRALLITKQVLAAKELIMEAKKTITFTTLKASEATVATATGAAKTAAVGFPQNIPLLIAYAVQAAGIVAAVVSAVRGAKSAAKGVGGSIPTPSASIGRGATSIPSGPPSGVSPEVNAGDQCIRAYVVSGDVTTSQEATARLNSKRTLG
jgi:hypothetical protein